MFNEQCRLDFQIGGYNDKVLCDNMPMDIFHILLGRLWEFDNSTVHYGRRNRHRFEEKGIIHVLMPLQ